MSGIALISAQLTQRARVERGGARDRVPSKVGVSTSGPVDFQGALLVLCLLSSRWIRQLGLTSVSLVLPLKINFFLKRLLLDFLIEGVLHLLPPASGSKLYHPRALFLHHQQQPKDDDDDILNRQSNPWCSSRRGRTNTSRWIAFPRDGTRTFSLDNKFIEE